MTDETFTENAEEATDSPITEASSAAEESDPVIDADASSYSDFSSVIRDPRLYALLTIIAKKVDEPGLSSSTRKALHGLLDGFRPGETATEYLSKLKELSKLTSDANSDWRSQSERIRKQYENLRSEKLRGNKFAYRAHKFGANSTEYADPNEAQKQGGQDTRQSSGEPKSQGDSESKENKQQNRQRPDAEFKYSQQDADLKLLGFDSPTTDLKTIRKNYHELSRNFHPDIAGPESTQKMQEINAAYARLKNAFKAAN